MRAFVHDAWDQTRGRPWLRMALIIYALIPVVIVLLMVASLVQRSQLQSFAEKIQQNRVEVTRRACEDQNTRHDDTVTQLDALIALAPANQRAQAKASEKYTVRLIDALVPVRDCDKVVARIEP